MNNVDEKVGLLAFTAELLLRNLNVLLELADGIFEGGTGIVNFVNNEDVLANEVGHFQGAQVQPLCTGDLGSGNFLGVTTTQVLVERQTDGLDGNIRFASALQERTV